MALAAAIGWASGVRLYAVLFIVGSSALVLVAIVTIVVLLNGIYGAWELVVWIALTRSQK